MSAANPTNSANPPDSIEYLYREYARLGDTLTAYSQSAFEDIKLLAAIGVLLVAWQPLTQSKLFGGGNPSIVLLVGFIAILLIAAIIGMQNLLKGSMYDFYLQQLGFYEAEIRTRLGESDTKAFRLAEGWKEWERGTFMPIATRYYSLFIVPLSGFPTAVLAFQDPWWYAAIYLGCALFALVLYLSIAIPMWRGDLNWQDTLNKLLLWLRK